jgi:hypothetical protein
MTERTIAKSNTAILFRGMLWSIQFFLGATAGLMIADAAVTTHVTVLEEGSRVSRVRVEVRVWNIPIHEETGFVNTEDGIWELNKSRRVTVSDGQFLLVYGIIAGSALVGSAISLTVGILLRRSGGWHALRYSEGRAGSVGEAKLSGTFFAPERTQQSS